MKVKLILEIPEPSTTKHLEDELWMELVDALRPTHIKPLEIEIENRDEQKRRDAGELCGILPSASA